MRTKTKHCDLRTAIGEAQRLNAQSQGYQGQGNIRKWSNGREEVVFVPDHAYSNEGTLTVRKVARH